MLVTFSSTYGATITASPTLTVLSSPDGGASWDTDAYATFSVSYAASTTRRVTVPLDPATAAASVLYFQVAAGDANSITTTVTVQEVDG